MDGGYIRIYKILISASLVYSMQNKGIQGLLSVAFFSNLNAKCAL